MTRLTFPSLAILSVCMAATVQLPAQEAAPPNPETQSATDATSIDEEYELLKLFADTYDQVQSNYVKKVSKRELIEAAIEGMLTKLDQHSNYIDPDEIERFNTDVESEFGGIGIQVNVEGDWITVISPIVGSPAYRGGIEAGDAIFKIDDKSAKGMKLDDAVKLMKGKIGTTVEVSVRRRNGDIDKLTLNRELVRVQTVLGDTRNSDDSWNFMYDSDDKIGYIRMTAFGRHTTEELKKSLEQLKAKEVKGLVLDLRFNPGGLLSSAIDICDLFISEGKIVSTEGRNAPKREWSAHTKGTYEGFPMVVLVNQFSASASEIVSACLQDHDRAVVIGERSFGKGSVQNIIELEGGKSALKLTTAGYLRPSGKNIHRFEDATDEDEWGVKPNEGFEVKVDSDVLSTILHNRRERDIINKEADPIPAAKDPQLDKALEYLRKQLKDRG